MNLRVLAWATLAVALVARVAFLADKPLWRDEAWVALLVDDPMRAAGEGRAVPLGFLLLTRLVSTIPLGPPEVTLRLLPLLCGLAAVPLVSRLAVALGASRSVAVAAMALAAGMQPLVYYSRELKSYGLDFAVAVVAPLLALSAFRGAAVSPGPRIAFLATVVAAPWLSFGGIFAVGAVFAHGWLAGWWRGDRGRAAAWALCSAAFAVSFAAVWFVALSRQSADPWMHSYWQASLGSDDGLALPLRLPAALVQYVRSSTEYFFAGAWPAFLPLAVLGAWKWPQPGRAFLVSLYAGTAALAAVAAATDHYLLVSGRLLLMAAPAPLLWTACGLDSLCRVLLGEAGRRVALGLALAASLVWTGQSIHRRTGPYSTRTADFFRYDLRHDVDAAIEGASALGAAGEPVLVSRRCSYAFRFYNRDRLRDATYCRNHCDGFRDDPSRWLARLGGRGWILLGDEDMAWMRESLGSQRARLVERAVVDGVRVWEVGTRERGPRARNGAAARRRAPSRANPSSTPTTTTTWPM